MEDKNENNNSWVSWIIVIAIIYGISSLFGGDESVKSEYIPSSSYNTVNSIDSRKSLNYEDDGYAWAEDNDVSSFGECQDQFGTSYEEDECNRYVKENYSGYKSFSGYECTEDCSGHEAGYDWAEDNDISDEYDCDGNSNSFNEGCTAYVEENY